MEDTVDRYLVILNDGREFKAFAHEIEESGDEIKFMKNGELDSKFLKSEVIGYRKTGTFPNRRR